MSNSVCVRRVSRIPSLIQDIHTSHCEAETNPYDFAKTGTTLTGLGCGLLAAAAVAVSPTLADLAVNGAVAVRIAFRLGIHVYETSSLLEAPEGSADAESWAYVIPGVSAETVQAELDEYNKKTVSLYIAETS